MSNMLAEAAGAGPIDAVQINAVKRACAMIECATERVPSLAELAKAVGISPTRFQKIFKRKIGVSPRQYAEQKRVARVKSLLRQGEPVAGAIYEVGYGSSRGLYETAHASLGMTPATYRKGGLGAAIGYAFGDSRLGRVLVAATETGVCFVALGASDAGLKDELDGEFPAATIAPDPGRLGRWLAEVLRRIEGAPAEGALPLDVLATAFQRRVWQALSAIPRGETRTYASLADAIGAPRSQRAVGRACATNPVSIVIPCHRAVRGDGGFGGYRWGLERKKSLLEAEGAAAGALPLRRAGRGRAA